MKVFAFGGSGKVGRDVLGLLAPSDLVTEIAVAGRNLAHAEQAATAIGSKATAVQADAGDERALAQCVAGYDLIVNAATDPTVLPVLRAAIAAGCHYCDVNLVEEALGSSADAEAAGITAIIENGIGPGLSSLMGVHVAHQLDEVKQLQRGMASLANFDTGIELSSRQWLEDPDRCRAALHEFRSFLTWMLQMMRDNGRRTMVDHQHGQWLDVDPIQQGVDVPFDGGCGMLHPYVSLDPLWQALPTDLAETAPMEMWFSALPPRADAVLRAQARRVLEEGIDPETAIAAFFDVIDGDPGQLLVSPADYLPVPIMWLRATGYRHGRPARCDCWVSAPLPENPGYFLTNGALAAAALKILRGDVTKRGVMTAEQAFDPPSFFEEIAGLLPEPPSNGKLVDVTLRWRDEPLPSTDTTEVPLRT